MDMRRWSYILVGTTLAIGGLLIATLIYLDSNARARFDEDRARFAAEFGLSGSAADFAFECSISGHNVLWLSDRSLLQGFCGCLASDMAGSLNDEDLDRTTELFRRHGLDGVEVPTARTAKSDAERRIADALQRGNLACRTHLDPRP